MRDVIVTGTGRSGTSLLAGTLAHSTSEPRYFLGGEPYPPRDANPKGFFETHEVNGINELLLAPIVDRHPRLSAGQRWLALPAPQQVARIAATPDLARRMAELCARRPFCFKDPRFAWTLPVWAPYVGDALRLVVFRHPARTAESIVRECATARYLAGVEMSEQRALALWRASYERLIELAAADGGEWRFVHYDQLFDASGLERLEAWSAAQVARDFPDAALARSRGEAPIPAELADVYGELCALAQHEPREAVRIAAAATSEPSAPWAAGPGDVAPELSVIVCTYQRKDILAECLASFEAQATSPGRFELVIVNDGSTDGTRELLDAWTFRVPTTLVHRQNGGLAAARNSALARARGRILLFVNDDTIAFPDLVEQHLAQHARLANREPAVLGTFEQPTAARDHALTRALEDGDLVFRYKDLRSGESYDHNRFWTCNVSVPADLVRRAGGFDEGFKHYGAEDIDLGVRLEDLGCRVVYCAEARAHHHHVLDFDQFARRQRLVAKAFVRLFQKHPRCLEHPDWSWMRDEDLVSLDAQVARAAARAFELEQAARELSRIDLGAFDAALPTTAALAGRIVRTIEDLVRELNPQWWRAGFADGLREFGLTGFAELAEPAPRGHACAAASGPPGAQSGGLDAETAFARLEQLRALAGGGASDLATIEGIRLGAQLEPSARPDGSANEDARAVYGALLNDLAVLRHGAGDAEGAVSILHALLELDRGHDLARVNLVDVEHSLVLRRILDDGQAPNYLGGTGAGPTELNPWVRHALDEAKRTIGLRGKDVIEVGGAVPEKAALGTGATTWRAGFLNAPTIESERYEVCHADARALPYADASCDVVFSSCAFEHVNDMDQALAEMARVLRPGGAIVTLFAPIWSCAVGHHLWIEADDGRQLSFMDRVVPNWGHLLLEERELAWFLTLARTPRLALRAAAQVAHAPHVNRVFEDEFKRFFAAAGFDASGLVHMDPWLETPAPSDAMHAALEQVHPSGGDFHVPGFRGVLVHAGAAALAEAGR